MIEKKITAKIDKLIKLGSLEEEQAKEMLALENLLPECPKEEEKKDKEEIE